MKNNINKKRVNKSFKVDIDKKSLVFSLVVSVVLFAYIIFKYGIVQIMNLIKGNTSYSDKQIFSLVIAYIICIIFVVTIINSIRMLLNKEPMLVLNQDLIMINSTLGKEKHSWDEFESYRVIKKGSKYVFYLESKNKKQFIRNKNFAKRIVYVISYLFGTYGIECNFLVSERDASMVSSIINSHVKLDTRGFKKAFKKGHQ